MNIPQKVVLLIGTLVLLFMLLFMDGMNHDGIGAVAIGGFFAIAAGIYLLRDNGQCPSDSQRSDKSI